MDFDLNRNLIAQLGLESAPQEVRERVLSQAEELIMKRIMVRLMDALPSADVDEANRLSEEDPEAMLAFMAGRVEDFPSMLAAEIERVKSELVLNASAPEAR